MAAALAEEQYECRLEAVAQTLFKTLDTLSGLFQFITPNIRNEIDFLTKHYRRTANSPQSILPELEALLEQLEEDDISFGDFLDGYEKDGTRI